MTQTWGIAGMSLAMGYTLGCFNPSALIATCKKTDLREQNTGNLGTSNTMLTFGWGWGLLVLLVDVGKAVIASLLASLLFSSSSSAGLLAGGASVVGHVFPIYLKFRGGKGLAPFLGMILAYDPCMFLILLTLSVFLSLILKYTAAMPTTVALLFSPLVFLKSRTLPVTLIALLTGGLVIYAHRKNIVGAIRRRDRTVREYLSRILCDNKTSSESPKS